MLSFSRRNFNNSCIGNRKYDHSCCKKCPTAQIKAKRFLEPVTKIFVNSLKLITETKINHGDKSCSCELRSGDRRPIRRVVRNTKVSCNLGNTVISFKRKERC